MGFFSFNFHVAAAKSLQLCPILCDPIDGSHWAPLSMGLSRQERWSGVPFPSPDLSDQGIEPMSVSCIGKQVLYHWATKERNGYYYGLNSVQVILLQMATTIGRYFMPNALPSPFFTLEVKVKSAQSCLTLYSPMDSPWTAHRILQARILVVIPFSTGSSQPRDRIQVSCTAGRFFTSRATREAL